MLTGAFHHMPNKVMRGMVLLLATGTGLAGTVAQAQGTQEEINSPGIYRINAPAAYGRSIPVTGANVTIAIVDTGLLTTHPEFAGRVLPGYNVFDGSQNAMDGNGHGTHVTGILGAGRGNPSTSGMFGVAYNAYLMPIRVLNNFGFGSNAGVATGIQVAVNRRNNPAIADVYKPFAMNLSLGGASPSAEIENALRNAVLSASGGMFVAIAAGNNGGANPDYPARYAREAWANGQILAVGAVDSNNVIASFSNRAGDTRNFFIVAPGVDIYSTFVSQGRATYDTLSGTSMATPYVTGAAALVKSGWPFLTAQQIGSILRVTATDLGAPGVDEIYGYGLLNLQQAQQPVGLLTVPTGSGSSVLVSGTAVTTSVAAGSSVQAAGRAGLLQVAGFDSYGRNFTVDLAPTVRRATPGANVLAPMFASVDAMATRTNTRNEGTVRYSYRSDATQLALGTRGQSPGGGFTMSMLDWAGREVFLGLSGMGGQAFGLAGELARRGEAQLTTALANPYFSLAQQHMHAGIGLPLSGGMRIKVGMLVSDARLNSYDGTPQTTGRNQNVSVAELSGEHESFLWTAGFSRLQESDSTLGTTQAGALNFAGSTGTNVLNIGVTHRPAARMSLGAQYSVGYTGGVSNRAESLVSGYSPGRSESYTAFVSFKEPFRPGDNVTLTVSQPLRMSSGSMQMVVPVAADAVTGTPVMAPRQISLSPDGREVRADVLYMSPIDRHSNWFLGAGVRQQPNHDATAPSEWFVGGGVRREF